MSERITSVTVEETGTGLYTQRINASGHALVSDEPVTSGGTDAGPSPYDLLLSALGSCTAMTVRMYANHKGWNVKRIAVMLSHIKMTDGENKKHDIITRDIRLEGNLDDEQRQRLLEIANKCPVHRTLTEEPRPMVTTRMVE